MSQSLEQFREQVLQNPSLSEQFKSAPSPDAFAELAVRLGQQMGYRFTAEDVKAAIAQHSTSGELSNAQLEAVAGGSNYTDNCAITNPTCENQCN